MKKYLKSLIVASFALASTSANAAIYRIDFTYGNDLSSENAGLEGFIYINSNLDTGNQLTTDNPSGYSNGSGGLPAWLTFASLTYDPTPSQVNSGDEITKTTNTFRLVKWDLKVDGTFNIANDFVPQMNGFGLVSTDADNSFTIGNGSFKQNYVGKNPALPLIDSQQQNSESEFLLASTTTTPGELPILGLGALVYYYKKFKNKKLSS